MSDAIAKRDRDLGNFIPGPSLDIYQTRFAGHFALDRRDGVPTVAVINGPGPRLELPLMCDLTLGAPDVVFGDGNFRAGSVPGDGMFLVLRELAGVKRASHAVYTGQGITAEEAQRLGIVSEVLPRGDLWPRALDLGEG